MKLSQVFIILLAANIYIASLIEYLPLLTNNIVRHTHY